MHKQQPWLKKVDTKFDVPMGSYDGAEKCELVGSLSSFPNGKTSTLTLDFTETADWPFQTPHREKQTTENMPRFFSTRRRKKLFRYGRGIFNHRRTISHNASSKKSINFYAECTRITVPLVDTLTKNARANANLKTMCASKKPHVRA